MSGSSERSPWFYVGAGCGCLALVAIVVVAVLVWSGARMVENVKKQLTDPELRTEKALELLGADELPQGYLANLSISIPLFGSFVILSDQADIEQATDGKYFIYMKSRMFAGKLDSEGQVIEDPDSVREALQQQGFDLEQTEQLGVGSFESGPQHVSFASYRGRFRERGRRSSEPVIATVSSIRCPDDNSVGRIGLWILPLAQAQDAVQPEEPAPDAAQPETLAPDPAELQAFLAPFDFCRN